MSRMLRVTRGAVSTGLLCGAGAEVLYLVVRPKQIDRKIEDQDLRMALGLVIVVTGLLGGFGAAIATIGQK